MAPATSPRPARDRPASRRVAPVRRSRTFLRLIRSAADAARAASPSDLKSAFTELSGPLLSPNHQNQGHKPYVVPAPLFLLGFP